MTIADPKPIAVITVWENKTELSDVWVPDDLRNLIDKNDSHWYVDIDSSNIFQVHDSVEKAHGIKFSSIFQ